MEKIKCWRRIKKNSVYKLGSYWSALNLKENIYVLRFVSKLNNVVALQLMCVLYIHISYCTRKGQTERTSIMP